MYFESDYNFCMMLCYLLSLFKNIMFIVQLLSTKIISSDYHSLGEIWKIVYVFDSKISENIKMMSLEVGEYDWICDTLICRMNVHWIQKIFLLTLNTFSCIPIPWHHEKAVRWRTSHATLHHSFITTVITTQRLVSYWPFSLIS